MMEDAAAGWGWASAVAHRGVKEARGAVDPTPDAQRWLGSAWTRRPGCPILIWRMPDLKVPTASPRPANGRPLWLRILGLTILGGVLLLVISLPGLASDDQQTQPGAWWYVALALIIATVMSRTYVIVRRSASSKPRALVIAIAVVPASYIAAILFFWLIATVSS